MLPAAFGSLGGDFSRFGAKRTKDGVAFLTLLIRQKTVFFDVLFLRGDNLGFRGRSRK